MRCQPSSCFHLGRLASVQGKYHTGGRVALMSGVELMNMTNTRCSCNNLLLIILVTLLMNRPSPHHTGQLHVSQRVCMACAGAVKGAPNWGQGQVSSDAWVSASWNERQGDGPSDIPNGQQQSQPTLVPTASPNRCNSYRGSTLSYLLKFA